MALVSLCDTGLIGLFLMFLSVSLSGLLFILIESCFESETNSNTRTSQIIPVSCKDTIVML